MSASQRHQYFLHDEFSPHRNDEVYGFLFDVVVVVVHIRFLDELLLTAGYFQITNFAPGRDRGAHLSHVSRLDF